MQRSRFEMTRCFLCGGELGKERRIAIITPRLEVCYPSCNGRCDALLARLRIGPNLFRLMEVARLTEELSDRVLTFNDFWEEIEGGGELPATLCAEAKQRWLCNILERDHLSGRLEDYVRRRLPELQLSIEFRK